MDFKSLVEQLQHIETFEELQKFAGDNNISDLGFIRKTWELIKEKAVKPTAETIKSALKPVGEAIRGRTKFEIEQAGQRLAQQIYPQGFQQQQVSQFQVQQFDIVRYLPYLAIATLIVLLIKKKQK